MSSRPISADQATVPCELCKDPTTMLGTKRCDRCYELETRIQSNPQLARKILAKTMPAGSDDEIARALVLWADTREAINDRRAREGKGPDLDSGLLYEAAMRLRVKP
jgi:hypothetical protein